EAERQSIRHPARRVAGTIRALDTETESIGKDLERVASSLTGEVARELRQLKNRLEEKVGREAAQLRQTVEGYSSVAAIGQMTVGLMPVIPLELDRMQRELTRLRTILGQQKLPEARQVMAALEDSLAGVREYHRMMLAAAGTNERRRAIDV